MTMRWLWDDYVMTKRWLLDDYEMTMKWLWDNYEMTMKWLWDDHEMTMRWLWDDYDMTYRRTANLKNYLIRSKVPEDKGRERRILPGMKRCPKNCAICPYIEQGKTLKSDASNTSMILRVQWIARLRSVPRVWGGDPSQPGFANVNSNFYPLKLSSDLI